MKLRTRLLAACAISVSGAFQAIGGTGAGNEFFYKQFAFRIGSPTEWSCTGCIPDRDAATPVVTSWVLTAPNAETHMTLSFVANEPADSLPALFAEIRRAYPGVVWRALTPTDRGGFPGYTSAPAGDVVPQAVEFYFVAKHRVIRNEWQKGGDDEQAIAELNAVIDSIALDGSHH